MDKPAATKSHFKTSEGRYSLWSERTAGLVPFANGRATRLTLAALRGGQEAGQYMLFNVGEQLHISSYDSTDKVRPAARACCSPRRRAAALRTARLQPSRAQSA